MRPSACFGRAVVWRGAAAVVVALVTPTASAAQVCGLTDVARALVPADPPAAFGYDAPPPAPFEDAALGVGHAYHAPEEPPTGPPGDQSWMQRVELPLFETPGAEPSAWIARGWIVAADRDPRPLTIWGLIETGYEERSFMVLETRQDEWLRIRYARDEESWLSAWVSLCALGASPAPLAYAPWSDWLLGDDISPLFVRAGLPLALHAEPSDASATVASVTEADVLDPHEVRGEWMRVTLKQPSDYCRPDVVSTSREGWVRWLTEDRGPRVWYFTRGC